MVNGELQPERDAPAGPVLTIAAGQPTAEEVAALVAVLLGTPAAGPPDSSRVPGSGWASRSRQLRSPLVRGPGAWRASSLPPSVRPV
jgi:hypothetical protein